MPMTTAMIAKTTMITVFVVALSNTVVPTNTKLMQESISNASAKFLLIFMTL